MDCSARYSYLNFIQRGALRIHPCIAPCDRTANNIVSEITTEPITPPARSHGGKPLRTFTNIILITLGVLMTGMGLRGFLAPTQFIDGGVTGVSMLLGKVNAGPLPVWLMVLNFPFVFLGYRMIGGGFAIRSAVAIVALAVSLAALPYPVVTTDKLLAAVFGGLCIGGGIGLAIRGGAVLDGTEVAALLISRSTHLLRVGDVILIINVIIFSAAAFLLGIEPAMYSLLTYFSASRAIEFLLHGLEEYTAIIVTSGRGDDVREAIVGGLNHAATVYIGRGGLSGEEQSILHCVVTRLEIGAVKNAAKTADPNAFIITYPLSDVEGGVMKRRAVH